MKRRMLPIVCLLFICHAHVAVADDDEWIGQEVMLKETAVPQVGTKRFKWTDVPVPAVVQKTNGDWLWLNIAWVKKDDVVPIDDGPAYFTRMIEGRKHAGDGYVLRGVCWLSKRDFDNAIKDFSTVLRDDPKAFLYCLRGKAYHGKRSFALALADFSEAVRLEPTYLIAQNDRGCTWNAMDEYGKALKQFGEILRVDPRNALAYGNRSATWFDLDEYEKSLDDVNHAIQLDPKLAFAYANRGRWYMKHGDYPKALDDYNKSIELAPREWAAYNGIARIYSTAPIFQAHIRDGKQALDMAKKACELSQWDEWMPIASLAAAYAELGNFEEAVRWQSQAIKKSQPAKDHDQRDNLKRLERYKSGQAYYEEVSSLKDDAVEPREPADDGSK